MYCKICGKELGNNEKKCEQCGEPARYLSFIRAQEKAGTENSTEVSKKVEIAMLFFVALAFLLSSLLLRKKPISTDYIKCLIKCGVFAVSIALWNRKKSFFMTIPLVCELCMEKIWPLIQNREQVKWMDFDIEIALLWFLLALAAVITRKETVLLVTIFVWSIPLSSFSLNYFAMINKVFKSKFMKWDSTDWAGYCFWIVWGIFFVAEARLAEKRRIMKMMQ